MRQYDYFERLCYVYNSTDNHIFRADSHIKGCIARDALSSSTYKKIPLSVSSDIQNVDTIWKSIVASLQCLWYHHFRCTKDNIEYYINDFSILNDKGIPYILKGGDNSLYINLEVFKIKNSLTSFIKNGMCHIHDCINNNTNNNYRTVTLIPNSLAFKLGHFYVESTNPNFILPPLNDFDGTINNYLITKATLNNE